MNMKLRGAFALLPAFLVLFHVPAHCDVSIREGKVTIEVYSQPLSEIIEQLQEQSKIQFSLEEEIAGETVSGSFQNLPVAEAIKKLLEGTGINYAVVSKGEREPPAVFIGSREQPGAPRRVLDTRPVRNAPRGVVTPVNPYPPAPPLHPPSDAGQEMQRQSAPSNIINVPTGGGYVPGSGQETSKEEETEEAPPPDEDE
jgi:hypothetical protein